MTVKFRNLGFGLRPRLLCLAISGLLSAPVMAQMMPLCPTPSVDEKLNINVPCVLFDGEAFQATLALEAGEGDAYYWSLGNFAPSACQPNLAACQTQVDANLNISFSGLNLFGSRHSASLTLSDMAMYHWNFLQMNAMPMLKAAAVSVSEVIGSVSFAGTGAKTLNLTVGIGSGAFHDPKDPANILYTVTDRGPNIVCGDSADVIGVADFCQDNGVVDNNGKIFPYPAFTPSIYKVRLGTTGNSYEVVETLPLLNALGNPITGTSNPLTVTDTENAYNSQGNKLPLMAEGLDTEALVRLSDGSFWLAEEYAPSLVHVAADGKIMDRVVPAGVEADLSAANYTVSGKLPAILKKRSLNRGLESVAVSPDNQYLYFIMQSPLANPDAAAYKASTHVRLFKASLENGELKEIVGEYLYKLDNPATFFDDASIKQNDVKVSEMLALGTDELIVLERISKHTKLYRVKLEDATNILGTSWDDEATTPSLEQVEFLNVAGITPLRKDLAFDTVRDGYSGNISAKIEGVALMDEQFVSLINDNDFGITGDSTEIKVAPLYQQLHSGGVDSSISLERIGRYQSGVFAESAAEIVAYDAAMKRVYVVNAHAASIDVLDVADPSNPQKIHTIEAGSLGASANSVAVSNGLLAVAIEATVKQDPGVIAIYNAQNFELITSVPAGALPDMVTFSPDGRYIIAANEGEPSADYTVDPEGSVTVVDLETQTVSQADFSSFDAASLRSQGVRIFGNNGASTAQQDLEPEYITVSKDSKTAYVSLQENNAIAVVDLASASVTNILALGFKDHSLKGNELDASNKDGGVRLANWPVLGMYMPDAISNYQVNGETYLVTANEGDSRDYDGYSEEARVADLTLDATAFPNAADLQLDANLGRLKTTKANGDTDGDGDFDQIYAYGARSFTIWNTDGEVVFDSGNDFESITANILGDKFNNDGTENAGDSRSDDKGPEPEALAIGHIGDQVYAFIGLERVGGIMVYNITNPQKPVFATYYNDRDFSKTPGVDDVGDISPEGMAFIPAAQSPNGEDLLVVGNEISGTTAIYRVKMR